MNVFNKLVKLTIASSIMVSSTTYGQSTVKYLGKGLINTSASSSMSGDVYGDAPYIIPMIYFGGVKEGKITPPDLESVRGSELENWFINTENGQATVFSINKQLKNEKALTTIRDMWATPFQQDDAKTVWFSSMKAEMGNVTNAKSFLVKIDGTISQYDINKQKFFLKVKEPQSCIISKVNVPFREESLNKIQSNNKRYGGNLICIQFRDMTRNRNPFRELPTPKDDARGVYENGSLWNKKIMVECEVKDLNISAKPSIYESKMFDGSYNRINYFASCEAKRLHIVSNAAYSNDPVYSVLSYEVDKTNESNDETAASQPVIEVKHDTVGDFKDSSKAKTFKKETQVIDITK